jgi:DNA-directed RNA polymerase specialized sigma24 family protein
MTWGKENEPCARGFEEHWPDLARGLDNALRARRVPASRREDIIQETGLRLFVRWAELDPDRPVWPFALTVAMNLMKDEQRMQARRNASPQPAGEVFERGVEEEALARLELTSVQMALQQLTPAQRSVLLADLGEAPYDDRGPAALKMLRMRARRTLRSMINRASGWLPVAGAGIRRAVNGMGVAAQRNAYLEQAHLLFLSTLGIAGAATIIGAVIGVADPAVRSSGTPAQMTMLAAAHHLGQAPSVRIESAEPAGGRVLVAGRGTRSGRVAARHGRDHSGPAGTGPATVGAGGTGIDEDASLHSDRWRVWVFAQATLGGQEATVDYEIEQANPACGSPTGTTEAARTCVRTEAPRARGRTSVSGGLSAGGAAP